MKKAQDTKKKRGGTRGSYHWLARTHHMPPGPLAPIEQKPGRHRVGESWRGGMEGKEWELGSDGVEGVEGDGWLGSDGWCAIAAISAQGYRTSLDLPSVLHRSQYGNRI